MQSWEAVRFLIELQSSRIKRSQVCIIFVFCWTQVPLLHIRIFDWHFTSQILTGFSILFCWRFFSFIFLVRSDWEITGYYALSAKSGNYSKAVNARVLSACFLPKREEGNVLLNTFHPNGLWLLPGRATSCESQPKMMCGSTKAKDTKKGKKLTFLQ